jgi:hypothetical protein
MDCQHTLSTKTHPLAIALPWTFVLIRIRIINSIQPINLRARFYDWPYQPPSDQANLDITRGEMHLLKKKKNHQEHASKTCLPTTKLRYDVDAGAAAAFLAALRAALHAALCEGQCARWHAGTTRGVTRSLSHTHT